MLRFVLALVATSSVAFAEDVPPWVFELALRAEIGLDKDSAGKPISVAPDIGIRGRRLRVELVHSSEAITGFHGIPAGTSFCVRGDVCDALDLYHNAGLQLSKVIRSHAAPDGVNPTAFSIDGGFIAQSFDPFKLAFKLGVRASYLTKDLVQIQAVPSVHVALTERDLLDDLLFVPLTVTIPASSQVTLQLETGLAAPFDNFADRLRLPVGLNMNLVMSEDLNLHLGFSLTAAYGGDAVPLTGLDARIVTVGLQWSKILDGSNPE